ncbi:MAG: sugar transferase [Ruminococcaceae bacterium]|nr:sugar transferase [Oscillospiraceae bacterium]
MYKKIIKRLFDVLAATILLVISSPVLLIAAIAIKLESKGPIIFKQVRLGKNAKEFYIYKFRTMVVNAEAGGVYSDNNDPRVTRVGGILRKTSIDELPQLVNIIKGEMSFIGPRPPLTYHPWPVSEYSEEQIRMFEVCPGITGWAQVNGRKEVEWNRRIELNVWYIDNLSLWLDIKILFMTVFKVFSNANNENVGVTVQKAEPVLEEAKPQEVLK